MSAYVLFFGGYKATITDIKAWIANATQLKPGVIFDGYPYPDGASWDGEEAVKAFRNGKTHDFAAAIKKIEGSTSGLIYLVGHSSGCAVANAVDAGLKDHKKIVLVALDGYAPSYDQLARPSTQVWAAESFNGKSMHYADMQDTINDYNKKAKNPKEVKIHTAPDACSTKLALHFSLVNLSSSDALVQHIPDGYKNCKAHLKWLL